MKIYNYIFLCGVACATAANATDARIYIALDADATCSVESQDTMSFTMTCSDGNYRGVSSKVLAMCAGNSGTLHYSGTPVLDATSAANNKYCWCRMITPGVGPWLYGGAPGDASYCASNCVSTCATEFMRYKDITLVQSTAYGVDH